MKQTIVITGGGEGLGKAIAKNLSKQNKIIILDIDEPKTKATANELGAAYEICDVTDPEKVANSAQEIAKRHGKIDIWINNAGIWIAHAPVESIEPKRLVKMFEVNVFGLIYGTQAALREMRRQNSGIILNIISTSALSGRPNSAAYCASKFAASGFTKSLQEELKESNIKVIAVYPGGMKTKLFDEAKPADYKDYMDPDYVSKIIVENLLSESPEQELIIKRPT